MPYNENMKKITKIKLFTESGVKSLEEEVNLWLSDLKEIVDIIFSDGGNCYTIMITYSIYDYDN